MLQKVNRDKSLNSDRGAKGKAEGTKSRNPVLMKVTTYGYSYMIGTPKVVAMNYMSNHLLRESRPFQMKVYFLSY